MQFDHGACFLTAIWVCHFVRVPILGGVNGKPKGKSAIWSWIIPAVRGTWSGLANLLFLLS